MNRLRLSAALAAASLLTTSCHLLHTQKAGLATATDDQTASPPAATGQVPAPALTPAGAIADGEPLLTLPGAAALPDNGPAGDFSPEAAAGTPAGSAYIPSPAEAAVTSDSEETLPPPPPPPAAELRGLRSPKLPSNLPMSLDGKLIH